MKRILPLLVLSVLLAPAAMATTVRSFTLPNLFREADLVAMGEVTGERSFWNAARDTIYTEYTVSVESVKKGATVATVNVRLMGGTVGQTSLTIAGNAALATGERVLLFLRDQGSYHTLVGMAQGKWTVRRVRGTDLVRRGSSVVGPEAPPQPGEKPLSELLERLDDSPDTPPKREVTP